MENKRSVSFWIEKTTIDLFQRTYRGCLSRFVVNCIKKALNDKEFFDQIFFNL